MIFPFYIKQVRTDCGCLSFILADESTRKACVIDPRVDQFDTYAEILERERFDLELVLDTHTHADHYSASAILAEEYGASIAMSEKTTSKRSTVPLKEGSVLELGKNLAIQAISTPGHTPDSLSFFVESNSGGIKTPFLFSGDTLFIGGSGRTDFPGADPADQYDSLYYKLKKLDDQTIVFPGHDYSGFLFSTIAKEKATNAHLNFDSKDSFIEAKKKELLDAPSIIQNILDYNITQYPKVTPRGNGPVTMCSTVVLKPTTPLKEYTVSELDRKKDSKKVLVVDVRDKSEFDAGHFADFDEARLLNLPMSQIPFFSFFSEQCSNYDEVIFSCMSGRRSLLALQTVERLAGEHSGKKFSHLAGGYLAWVKSGLKST